MSDTPLHLESWSSAQIDAARISVSTAQILVSTDPKIPVEAAARIIDHLEEGLTWLHAARQLMNELQPAPTSVHVVKPAEGRIITP